MIRSPAAAGSRCRRLGQRPADLSRAHRRGFPNLFMITGPGQPVGAVEHGGVDRAARRLGGRSPGGDARGRLHDHRRDRDGAGRLGAAHGRLLDDDAASAGQHLVHGRQRPGKAQGVMPIRGGVGPYRASATRSSAAACWASAFRPDVAGSATTARSFACSPTCGWCWACWRR